MVVTLRRLKAAIATLLRRRRAPYVIPTFSLGKPTQSLDKALALASEMEDAETVQKVAVVKTFPPERGQAAIN